MTYEIQIKNGEHNLPQAALREAHEVLQGIADYRVDLRTAKGKEIQKCLELIEEARKILARNEGFSK